MKLKLLSSLLTSLINTGIVTLVITLANAGLPLPVIVWLKTWALAAAIIFPLSLFVPERARALVSHLLKEPAAVNETRKEGLPR